MIDGERLVEIPAAPYPSEKQLQAYLARHPDLLGGAQMDETAPRRWLLIDRELGVPAHMGGSAQFAINHLFVDQDGVPTLVEVKRSTYTRLRREVVGQMFDYAANGLRSGFTAQQAIGRVSEFLPYNPHNHDFRAWCRRSNRVTGAGK